MFEIPFNFLNLFFLSSNTSILLWPFHTASEISFSDKLSLLRLGSEMLVSCLILLPERFKCCSWQSFSPANMSRLLTWFFDAFNHTKLSNPSTSEISLTVLVFRSRNLIYLKRIMIGNSRSSSFSARLRRVNAIDLLLAVLLNPVKAPLRAYSNFLRSSSSFSRASSSSLLRYYSLSRSSSSCCLRSSSICSGVFSGGASCYYSDMLAVVLLIWWKKILKACQSKR